MFASLLFVDSFLRRMHNATMRRLDGWTMGDGQVDITVYPKENSYAFNGR
jgi:hypothetical protein